MNTNFKNNVVNVISLICCIILLFGFVGMILNSAQITNDVNIINNKELLSFINLISAFCIVLSVLFLTIILSEILCYFAKNNAKKITKIISICLTSATIITSLVFLIISFTESTWFTYSTNTTEIFGSGIETAFQSSLTSYTVVGAILLTCMVFQFIDILKKAKTETQKQSHKPLFIAGFCLCLCASAISLFISLYSGFTDATKPRFEISYSNLTNSTSSNPYYISFYINNDTTETQKISIKITYKNDKYSDFYTTTIKGLRADSSYIFSSLKLPDLPIDEGMEVKCDIVKMEYSIDNNVTYQDLFEYSSIITFFNATSITLLLVFLGTLAGSIILGKYAFKKESEEITTTSQETKQEKE